MSELRKTNLSFLTKNEIVDFYELFFGNILIKKPNFPYFANLSRSLEKDTFVKTVVERLNETEQKILRILSNELTLPYDYVVDKLNIILDMPNQNILKALNYLIDKKYIFLRDAKNLVAVDIFFPQIKEKTNLAFSEQKKENYSSAAVFEINNLTNFFVSSEIKFSANYNLYKKDMVLLKSVFSKQSVLTEKEINYIAYFYNKTFLNEEEIILDKIKDFFSLSILERSYFIAKNICPWIYSFLSYFKKQNKTLSINKDDFEILWNSSLLHTEFNFQPVKMNFKDSINFMEKLGFLKKEADMITFIQYNDEVPVIEDEVKLSSNFNLYINNDSVRSDYYLTAFFSNLKKNNKLAEYEITESSIKRSIKNNITLETLLNFFSSLNIKMSKNVETVINQWFEKYDSYCFCSGTVFFCSTPDKAKIIYTMIKNKLIKANEIKKDEIFYIKEEDKVNFFEMLSKADISFYNKKPKETPKDNEEKINDVSVYF